MSEQEFPPTRLHVTPAALRAVLALRAVRGEAVMFVQSAGCCAGSVPMCFPDGEFAVGEHDTLLGTVEGCPFYIDDRLDAAWNHPDVELDVAPGDPEGFSLAAAPGQRFISRPALEPSAPALTSRTEKCEGPAPEPTPRVSAVPGPEGSLDPTQQSLRTLGGPRTPARS